MTYTINTNEKYNSLEVSFSEKPNAETRNILKSLKFRWNPTKGIWYGYSTNEVLQEALNMEAEAPKKQLANEEIKTDVAFTDGYLGAIEMIGCNYSLSNDIADINKLVKRELKKAFPMFKTKTSLKRYSGGQSISFTLFVDSSYFKSDAELIEVLADHYCRYPHSWYLDYSINGDSTFEEVKSAVTSNLEILKKNAYRSYNQDSNFFTEKALAALDYAKRIYRSFNHDDSNGMVDYFDRYFYDSYYIVAVEA